MKALPDLVIEVQRRHVAEDAIVVEVVIRGTHLGGWRGLPRPGGEWSFRFVGSTHSTPMTGWLGRKSTTTGDGVEQLGVFHEPLSMLDKSALL